MNILVINCGSSSLKFQVINAESEKLLAKGLCERIGIDGSRIVYTPAGKDKITIGTPMPDHNKAIELAPEDGSAYSMRAMVKLDLGDMDGANSDLDTSNKLMNSK